MGKKVLGRFEQKIDFFSLGGVGLLEGLVDGMWCRQVSLIDSDKILRSIH